jgi:phosphoribosylformimino-5-aminoimidazole carboxamide ribotide isomerase
VPATDGQFARLVVGLESLSDRALLPAMLDLIGPERLTLSIDLTLGRPLAADARWRTAPPEQIAADALALGVRSLIVLDLAYVGESRGPGVSPLCSTIRRLDPSLELVSGGGVRGPHDLEALAAAGCDAALVASALHDGRLTAADLERFR